jgi:hypothetical protein
VATVEMEQKGETKRGQPELRDLSLRYQTDAVKDPLRSWPGGRHK